MVEHGTEGRLGGVQASPHAQVLRSLAWEDEDKARSFPRAGTAGDPWRPRGELRESLDHVGFGAGHDGETVLMVGPPQRSGVADHAQWCR